MDTQLVGSLGIPYDIMLMQSVVLHCRAYEKCLSFFIWYKINKKCWCERIVCISNVLTLSLVIREFNDDKFDDINKILSMIYNFKKRVFL